APIAVALRPSAPIRSTTSAAGPAECPWCTTTSAPAAASPSAMPAPMPWPAPVTRARRPVRSKLTRSPYLLDSCGGEALHEVPLGEQEQHDHRKGGEHGARHQVLPQRLVDLLEGRQPDLDHPQLVAARDDQRPDE